MAEKPDGELEKLVSDLVRAEVKKCHARMLDLSSKQIVINPLQDDPDAVPGGPYQFNGFVVNAAASDSITLALWTLTNAGNTSVSLGVARTPPTGRHWTTVAILTPGTDYGLQAILTDSTGATTFSTNNLFFSAVT
jgi:hypothetical protein